VENTGKRAFHELSKIFSSYDLADKTSSVKLVPNIRIAFLITSMKQADKIFIDFRFFMIQH